MKSSIAITCKANEHVKVSELVHFQGNLKNLPDEELAKLKNSILKYGFSFPIFVWQGNILDGHQRIKAVKSLIEDGYDIAELPVVNIEAADEHEAAEKLLLINSRYAQISQSGYGDFVKEFELDIKSIAEILSIPDIIIHETDDFNIEEHWQDMPEYNQDEGVDDPILSVRLHFYSESDIKEFNRINDLNINEDTRYINYNKADLKLKNYSYE